MSKLLYKYGLSCIGGLELDFFRALKFELDLSDLHKR